MSDGEKAALAARLDRIERLTDALVRAQADSVEARDLAFRIKREVEVTRAAIATFTTHPSSRR